MTINPAHKVITEQEYLQGELCADTRHELINGVLYEMTEACDEHNLITLNVESELRAQIKGTSYRTFMRDMKVKIGHDFLYPDVMVVCPYDNDNDHYKIAPVVIVEVLSKTTRRFDQTDKRLRYQQIPGLEEYVLIEQDKGEVQVFSKRHYWQSLYYYLGDEMVFPTLGITLRVEDIYYRVNNEDVLEFLQTK